MSTSRLLNLNGDDNQKLVSEAHGIVLTAEQKIIFKKFIDSLIDNSDLKNLLIRESIWLKANADLTTKFWDHHASMLSFYHGLATIPLIPAVRETLEEFFLQNPEAMENSYIENSAALQAPYSHSTRESKPYSLLKRLPEFLQSWALEDKQRAQLIANHPELYKHSKENVEKERSLTDSRWYKFTAVYFLVAAIAFAAVAAAASITFLAGAGAFVFLTLGSAYLAYRSIKQAKTAPVAELADSHDAENDENVLQIKPEPEKTVQVSVSLSGNSENPVKVNIGPFFNNSQNKPDTTMQNGNESKLEDQHESALGLR